MMTLWAETFRKMYPNVEGPGRREGVVDGAGRADRRHLAVRADVAPDARDRDRPVRGEVRLQADRAQDQLRRPRGLREQGQPDREADARAGRGHLLEEPQARVQGRHQDVGPARADRRLGEPPHQPLRPQLGQRHLRVLQGAHPEERRLQEHRQGAARFRVGRPGRDRGPLRHRLQRHRLQDVRREGRAPGGDRQGRRSPTAPTPTCRAASTRCGGSSTST